MEINMKRLIPQLMGGLDRRSVSVTNRSDHEIQVAKCLKWACGGYYKSSIDVKMCHDGSYQLNDYGSLYGSTLHSIGHRKLNEALTAMSFMPAFLPQVIADLKSKHFYVAKAQSVDMLVDQLSFYFMFTAMFLSVIQYIGIHKSSMDQAKYVNRAVIDQANQITEHADKKSSDQDNNEHDLSKFLKRDSVFSKYLKKYLNEYRKHFFQRNLSYLKKNKL